MGISLKGIVKAFNKAGSDIKHQAVRSAHDVGGALDNKWVKLATAAALAGTGVGAPAAAAIMGAQGLAGGALKKGGGLKSAAGGALKGAASGATVGALGGGLSALRSGAGVGTALKTATGMGPGGGMAEGAGELASEGGRFRSIGSFLKNNARTIADYGQMGEGIYDRYQQNRQYNDARDDYAAAKPLRDAAMQGLLDTSRPDVSSIFADPTAPQGRYRRVNVGSRGGY